MGDQEQRARIHDGNIISERDVKAAKSIRFSFRPEDGLYKMEKMINRLHVAEERLGLEVLPGDVETLKEINQIFDSQNFEDEEVKRRYHDQITKLDSIIYNSITINETKIRVLERVDLYTSLSKLLIRLEHNVEWTDENAQILLKLKNKMKTFVPSTDEERSIAIRASEYHIEEVGDGWFSRRTKFMVSLAQSMGASTMEEAKQLSKLKSEEFKQEVIRSSADYVAAIGTSIALLSQSHEPQRFTFLSLCLVFSLVNIYLKGWVTTGNWLKNEKQERIMKNMIILVYSIQVLIGLYLATVVSTNKNKA